MEELHRGQAAKRYHLNDRVLYYQREEAFVGSTKLSPPPASSTNRISMRPGRRALVLSC